MNATTLLAISGATFEVFGLALVVAEIWKDRRQGRSLMGIEAVIVQTLPAIASATAGKVTPIGGRQPTLEERVERVEERAEALNDGLLYVQTRLRTELEQAAEEAFNRAYRATIKRDQSLRRFLHQQLAGGVGRRLLGVVFFALGTVLSAVGNVMAN